MADLDDLGPLARTIEPLPGGLGQLRDRLRAHRSRRVPIAFALAASCCAALAVWLLCAPQEPPPDRTAMRHLLVDADHQANPRAVALGLVAPSTPAVASDPRITPSDDIVFYWVPPARSEPPREP